MVVQPAGVEYVQKYVVESTHLPFTQRQQAKLVSGREMTHRGGRHHSVQRRGKMRCDPRHFSHHQISLLLHQPFVSTRNNTVLRGEWNAYDAEHGLCIGSYILVRTVSAKAATPSPSSHPQPCTPLAARLRLVVIARLHLMLTPRQNSSRAVNHDREVLSRKLLLIAAQRTCQGRGQQGRPMT